MILTLTLIKVQIDLSNKDVKKSLRWLNTTEFLERLMIL